VQVQATIQIVVRVVLTQGLKTIGVTK